MSKELTNLPAAYLVGWISVEKFDIPMTGIAVTTCPGSNVARRSGSCGMDFSFFMQNNPVAIRLPKLASLPRMTSPQCTRHSE